ncbi:hypothetical protein CH063_03611, partial [Colletotrichum higginsianum]
QSPNIRESSEYSATNSLVTQYYSSYCPVPPAKSATGKAEFHSIPTHPFILSIRLIASWAPRSGRQVISIFAANSSGFVRLLRSSNSQRYLPTHPYPGNRFSRFPSISLLSDYLAVTGAILEITLSYQILNFPTLCFISALPTGFPPLTIDPFSSIPFISEWRVLLMPMHLAPARPHDRE